MVRLIAVSVISGERKREAVSLILSLACSYMASSYSYFIRAR